MRTSRLLALAALALSLPLAACQPTEAPDADVDTPEEMESMEEAPAEEPMEEAPEAPAESVDSGQSAEPGGLLETVRNRGSLICGVNDQLPGFGSVNPDGEYEGFDVDVCRAIAAGVLGDAEAVEFRPLSAQQRFTALQTGEVDVLSRNTTWTLSRDTQNGLDFAPTTFYDGQGMMVRVADGVETLADLDTAPVCVGSGTTTEKNLEDAMSAAGATYEPVVLDSADEVFASYDSGRCAAVTADRSALVSRQTTLETPSDHIILDVVMSKEPLGPAVLQGDAQWADVVNWIVFGLIQAEEFGIDSTNVEDFSTSENPEILRFLGVEDALGEGLGLANDFMVQVISQTGNYAEIYDRNLGPDTPFDLARGVNQLWTDGGLLYAPPFR